jgi:biopolymer transport protein TolR
LLVLLIIFMVISPRREQKLPVTAPEPAPNSPPSAETLMLEVDDKMQLALNTKPLSPAELPEVLATLMEQRTVEHRTLLIKAPGKLPYDPVVSLIGRVKRAGAVTIGLIATDS